MLFKVFFDPLNELRPESIVDRAGEGNGSGSGI